MESARPEGLEVNVGLARSRTSVIHADTVDGARLSALQLVQCTANPAADFQDANRRVVAAAAPLLAQAHDLSHVDTQDPAHFALPSADVRRFDEVHYL